MGADITSGTIVSFRVNERHIAAIAPNIQVESLAEFFRDFEEEKFEENSGDLRLDVGRSR